MPWLADAAGIAQPILPHPASEAIIRPAASAGSRPAIWSCSTMLRLLFAFGALLSVGAVPAFVSAADTPAAGVTAFKDAKAEGYFTLDAKYLTQKKPIANPDYSADGFGLANVYVLLRKTDQGAFNGQY